MAKAQSTRAYIIEKTAAIFNKKGYAGTSLSDLTKATGLTKGALYGNFKNKDDIALAVYDFNIAQVKSIFLSDPDPEKSPLEHLLALPGFYKKHYDDLVAHGGCPIMNAAVEADDNHPLLKAKVILTIASWKKNIAAIIQKGVDLGEIKSNVNPAQYASVFIALLEGGLMLSKTTDDLSYFDDALDRITSIIQTELNFYKPPKPF